MSDDNISRLPEPGVILDLDSLERPTDERKPPFVVKLGGKQVTFADPLDIDWRDLASVNIPADLLRVALSHEDLDHIRNQPLDSYSFNKLMKSYYDYFGLEDKIREAQRARQFSGL